MRAGFRTDFLTGSIQEMPGNTTEAAAATRADNSEGHFIRRKVKFSQRPLVHPIFPVTKGGFASLSHRNLGLIP